MSEQENGMVEVGDDQFENERKKTGMDRKSVLKEMLGLTEEEAALTDEYMKSGEWITEMEMGEVELVHMDNQVDVATGLEEGTGKMEMPAVQMKFKLSKLLELAVRDHGLAGIEDQVERESRFKALVENFDADQELETEVTLSVYVDPDLEREDGDGRQFFDNHTEDLKKAVSHGWLVGGIKHGWTGSGADIVDGYHQDLNKEPERVNVLSAIYGEAYRTVGLIYGQEAAESLRLKMWGVAYDRLGMGLHPISEGCEKYGPVQDEKFSGFVDGFLGKYENTTAVNDENGEIMLPVMVEMGHSIGGNLVLLQAAKMAGNGEMAVLAANMASKSNDSAKEDPNKWNRTVEFAQAIRDVFRNPKNLKADLFSLLLNYSGKIEELMGGLGITRDIYEQLRPVVTRILVSRGYVPGLEKDRPDLVEKHIKNSVNNAENTYKTAIGNHDQAGVGVKTLIEAMRRTKFVAATCKDDQMVETEDLLKILLTPEECQAEGVAPMALLVLEKGGHYGLWRKSGEEVRNRILRAQMGLNKHQFDELMEQVYLGYKLKKEKSGEAEVGYGEVAQDNEEAMGRLEKVLGLEAGEAAEYVKKRQERQEQEAEKSVFEVAREMTGDDQSKVSKYARMELWLQNWELFVHLARYNEEND